MSHIIHVELGEGFTDGFFVIQPDWNVREFRQLIHDKLAPELHEALPGRVPEVLPKQQHHLLRQRRPLGHRRDKQQSLAHTQARAPRDRAVGESHHAYRGDAHPLYRSRLRRSEDTRRRR